MNVWDYEKAVTRFINKEYYFFTFKHKEEEVSPIEIQLRKEDFIADVMMKCHVKLPLYNEEKSAIITWCINVAIRLYIDKYRRKKRLEIPTNFQNYTEETSDTLLDIDSFEEFIKEDKELYIFYLKKKEDLEKDQILKEMYLTTDEYKLLDKRLKHTWVKFNEE
jgi:hypothetical protein